MKRLFRMCCVAAITASMVACAGNAKKPAEAEESASMVACASEGLDSLSYTVGVQSAMSLKFTEMKYLDFDTELVCQGMKDVLNMESVNEEEMMALQQEIMGYVMFAQQGIYMRMMNEQMGVSEEDSEVELPALYNETYTREDMSYKMGSSAIMSLKYNNIDIDEATLIEGFNDGMAVESYETMDDNLKLTEEQMTEQMMSLNQLLHERFMEQQNAVKLENAEKSAAWLAEVEKMEGVVKSESSLLYRIDRRGNGVFPTEDSDVVLVNYEGKLDDGAIFDSSYERNEPISFPLNGVIPGWTEGLKYIDEGGQITLWIPADLAYGENPRPGGIIEPNDALEFKVELLKVNPEE